MGCVASKPLTADDLHGGIFFPGGFDSNHVVSLTSTTYGALILDRSEPDREEEEREVIKRECRRPPPLTVVLLQKSAGKEEPPEIIDVRKLMEDLADETPFWTPLKKQEKQKRRAAGKENASSARPQESKRWDFDLNRILRPFSPSDNAKRSSAQTPGKKRNLTPPASARDSGGSASRRSLSPVFDPDLLGSLEREHLQERGTQNVRNSVLFLRFYEEKCPPGGKNTVVFYSTTLRGIRKTFEDCNAVRSVLESHRVQIGERDISMDSEYREELRSLMGSKGVSIPVVFLKGRLIGGAEEVLKLEEEGKLGVLLEELPRATVGCEACAGVRFIMCMDCRGSCKVLDEEQKKMAKCEECNENGLIHCPVCC